MTEGNSQGNLQPFLQGGGKMGELIRAFNWSNTPVGEPSSWPLVLKTMVAMMLHNSFPVLICWGADFIQLYNDAFRPINGRDKHPAALGASARETYSEIWDQIGDMFAGVMAGQTFGFPDFMVPLERNGAAEECFFDFSYSPILDENGMVGGIIVICMETTAKVGAIRALEIQQQNLRNTVRQAPVGMCIVSGNPLMAVEMNDLFLEIIGKQREPFLTIPYWEVNAEARTYYEPITDRVMATGETFRADEHEIILIRDGVAETVFVDFVYEPILDSRGKPDAIMIVAIEVTDKVIARKHVEEAGEEIQAINEEMTAANEDLSAANEELATINEELAQTNEELTMSESRFRNLIGQAPFAICVITAHNLVVSEVNNGYLELVGRHRAEVEGRQIWDAVSEAADVYAPILQDVINNGVPFLAREHRVELIRGGVAEIVFLDFVYEPVTDPNGQVISVMVVGIDVTDKVMARQSIAEVEERIRLAVDAAELGTYDYDYGTNKMVASGKFYQIFGFDHPVNREKILATYHPSDSQLSEQAHELARSSGKIFYETRLVLANGELRWARVQGNVHYDASGRRKRLIGTVVDITEYKRLLQQKDDFISIASHELKTPITSLKASLQLLERMKDSPNDKLPRLIEQSTRSMEKISELIEELLNVSKLTQGHMALNKSRFKVVTLMDSCCDHTRLQGKHKLIVTGNPELEIFADEHRIEQVIVNFVNNAVKYAPDSIEIHLFAEQVGKMVRISVADEGPGISEDKLPHLFDRYFRADESGGQISGLGLGLYICSEIVEKHDGKIGVDSVSGLGSKFWFEIPML